MSFLLKTEVQCWCFNRCPNAICNDLCENMFNVPVQPFNQGWKKAGLNGICGSQWLKWIYASQWF